MASFCGGGDAGETPAFQAFAAGATTAIITTAYTTDAGDARKGERSAAWRAGVSPAKRSASVISSAAVQVL